MMMLATRLLVIYCHLPLGVLAFEGSAVSGRWGLGSLYWFALLTHALGLMYITLMLHVFTCYDTIPSPVFLNTCLEKQIECMNQFRSQSRANLGLYRPDHNVHCSERTTSSFDSVDEKVVRSNDRR